MLNYHPSGDSYHCIYRLFLLSSLTKGETLEWDRLRLMDFYLLFPHLLKRITIPNHLRQLKQVFIHVPEPFEEIGSPKRLFFQIGTIQKSSVTSLVAKGYFDRDSYVSEMKIVLSKPIPEEIIAQVKADPTIEKDWFKAFLELFSSVELTGGHGLKVRSKMMEHRYDPT